MITKLGDYIRIAADIVFDGDALVGHATTIGDFVEPFRRGRIGSNARIGRFALIEGGVQIGSEFFLDDYSAVYSGSRIGSNVRLLYGKKIYGRSVVGNNCIIGGNLPERCVVGDDVTFMGEVAHSHYDPTREWDSTDEPSPKIGRGTVVGVNALLVGGVDIGEGCYVSAGEILRHDLPSGSVYLKGAVYPMDYFRGLMRSRN